MAVYLITYDLSQPDRDYPKIEKAIKSLGSWCHPLKSVWCIEHSGPAINICRALEGSIDRDDSVFVTEVKQPAAWINLPQPCVDWLNGKR